MTAERGNSFLKRADRYLGIPLVILAAFWRRLTPGFCRDVKTQLLTAQRIGIFATGVIGDTVIASALIIDIKRALPNADLVLITSEANRNVAPLVAPGFGHFALAVTRPLKALRELRGAKLDVLIDIGPWPRINALLSALSRVPLIVGFRTSGQYRHYAYDVTAPHCGDRHQLENFRALVRSIGVNASAEPIVTVPSCTVVPKGLPDRYVVFHAWPGGFRSEFKQWPESSWLTLAKRFKDKGLPIVLTGAKADVCTSSELSQKLADGGVDVHNWSGRCSLSETAAILVQAVLVISVDTGILHLAGAAGVPTIGLHGPSPSRRWGAIGPKVISLDSPSAEAGYLDLGFEYPVHPPYVMSEIRPDSVWMAVKTLCPDIVREGG